jgi:alpha-L-fucosidase
LIHAVDVARLGGMRDALDRMFAVQLAPMSDATSWSSNGGGPVWTTMALREPAPVSVLRLGENITRGQIVSAYTVSGEGMDGAWHELSRGTTIGHAKIDRIAPTTVRRIRVSVESSVAEPEPIGLWAY